MPIEIKVNDILIRTVSDFELQILGYAINSDTLEDLLAERIVQNLDHKLEQVQQKLVADWAYRGLAENGITTVPLDMVSLLTLIFAQPNYLDRKARDAAQLGE